MPKCQIRGPTINFFFLLFFLVCLLNTPPQANKFLFDLKSFQFEQTDRQTYTLKSLKCSPTKRNILEKFTHILPKINYVLYVRTWAYSQYKNKRNSGGG